MVVISKHDLEKILIHLKHVPCNMISHTHISSLMEMRVPVKLCNCILDELLDFNVRVYRRIWATKVVDDILELLCNLTSNSSLVDDGIWLEEVPFLIIQHEVPYTLSKVFDKVSFICPVKVHIE